MVIRSSGCLPIPSRGIEFLVLKYVMQNLMCVAEENLLRVLQRFHAEVSIAERLLISPEVHSEPRPWSPSDFAFVIGDYITETVENFRTLWVTNVVMLIEEGVLSSQRAGAAQRPQAKKVVPFVRRLAITMAEELQDITLSSIQLYKKIWREYFEPREPPNRGVRAGSILGPPSPDVLTSRTILKPMFRLKLVLTDLHFEFYPLVEEVNKIVLDPIVDMVFNMSNIMDLQSRLEEVFHLDKDSNFPAIASTHPNVIDAQNSIRRLCLRSF